MYGCNFLIRGGFNEITILKREIIYLIFWDRRINVILRHKFRTRIPDFSRNHHGTGLGGSASFDAGAVFFSAPIHGA